LNFHPNNAVEVNFVGKLMQEEKAKKMYTHTTVARLTHSN